MSINRQAVLREVGTPYEIIESTLPVPGPGQALINFTHSGCCYTDTHARWSPCSCFGGGHVRKDGVKQLVGGHEGIGSVVKLGSGVDASTVKVGDRVGMGFLNYTCTTCDMCKTNEESYCPQQLPTGFKVDGTFQQYAIFDANYLIHIPSSLDSAASAPLLCAGATVYAGLKAANIQPGQWVAVPGAGGGLGHIAVQYAKAMGAKVVGIDAGEKAGVVKACGADFFVDFQSEPDVAGAVNELTDGGAHAICVTGVPAYATAWLYARMRGTVICLAMGPTTFDASLAVVKGIKVLGSSVASREETVEALQLAAKHGIKAIIEIRGMNEIERTMVELKNGQVKGRVVIDLSK